MMATDEQIRKVMAGFKRFTVMGASWTIVGVRSQPPWFLIDLTTAADPDKFVSEHTSKEEANMAMYKLILTEAGL